MTRARYLSFHLDKLWDVLEQIWAQVAIKMQKKHGNCQGGDAQQQY